MHRIFAFVQLQFHEHPSTIAFFSGLGGWLIGGIETLTAVALILKCSSLFVTFVVALATAPRAILNNWAWMVMRWESWKEHKKTGKHNFDDTKE